MSCMLNMDIHIAFLSLLRRSVLIRNQLVTVNSNVTITKNTRQETLKNALISKHLSLWIEGKLEPKKSLKICYDHSLH